MSKILQFHIIKNAGYYNFTHIMQPQLECISKDCFYDKILLKPSSKFLPANNPSCLISIHIELIHKHDLSLNFFSISDLRKNCLQAPQQFNWTFSKIFYFSVIKLILRKCAKNCNKCAGGGKKHRTLSVYWLSNRFLPNI